MIGGHELQDAAPRDLSGLVAEHGRHALIDKRRPSLGIDQPDAFVRGLDQAAIALLALSELVLCLLAGGDVDHDHADAQDLAGLIPHRVHAHQMVTRLPRRERGRAAQLAIHQRFAGLEDTSQQGFDGWRVAGRVFGDRATHKPLDRGPQSSGERFVQPDPPQLAVEEGEAVGGAAQQRVEQRQGLFLTVKGDLGLPMQTRVIDC